MVTKAGGSIPWAPLADDELTWFRPGAALPARPTPLEFTLHVEAFVFGLSRALESLYFPLYEVRARLFDGELYLAASPSAMAEGNLEAQLQRLRDSAIRFSRDIRSFWERTVRAEVLEYNERMSAFAPDSATDAEVADELPRLQRVRANQWFAPIRAVIAPAVLLEQGVGQTPRDEALAVVEEVRELVVRQGSMIFEAALERIVRRLAARGSLKAPDDIRWLGYDEVRGTLRTGGSYAPIVAERRSAANATAVEEPPAWIGPPLPSDAPRMYLLRDVLDLIAG
jgi:hypothetical protein